MLHGLKFVALGVSLFFLLILSAIFLPCYLSAKPKAAEADTKSNIHKIQIALEQYAMDEGGFPPYLLGGDNEGWEYYNSHRGDNELELWDPLLAGGYLESYPVNSFHKSSRKDRKALKKFKEQVKVDGTDKFDPRFGLNGNKMGDALQGPIILVDQVIEELKGYPRICPGQFCYRAFREGDSPLELHKKPFEEDYQPAGPKTYYMICGFASITYKGPDYIRWNKLSGETPSEFPYIPKDEYYETSTGVATKYQLQLPEITYVWEVPRYPKVHIPDPNSLFYVKPDGIEDGILNMLTYSLEDIDARLRLRKGL